MASLLTQFGILSSTVEDVDVARLQLGNIQLDTIFLSCYHVSEAESLALLLALVKKLQWKLLRVRPTSSSETSEFKLFARILRIASKSFF